MSEKIGLLIGQAPAEKEYDYPYQATSLYSWLEKIKITPESAKTLFDFDAMINFKPGVQGRGHRVPTEAEILNHIPSITSRIDNSDYKVIVPIGKVAIEYLFETKNIALKNYVGQLFTLKPFGQTKQEHTVIPLPHPSGLSTWVYQGSNDLLLDNALDLLHKVIGEYV